MNRINKYNGRVVSIASKSCPDNRASHRFRSLWFGVWQQTGIRLPQSLVGCLHPGIHFGCHQFAAHLLQCIGHTLQCLGNVGLFVDAFIGITQRRCCSTVQWFCIISIAIIFHDIHLYWCLLREIIIVHIPGTTVVIILHFHSRVVCSLWRVG